MIRSLKQFICLLTLFSLTHCYGQTAAPEQELELTETNIKKLFSLNLDWSTCFVSDSGYVTADTIMLYSDFYYYMTTDLCHETSWTFINGRKFNISETKVCQEPPSSTIQFENSDLKMCFSKSEEILTMLILKEKVVKDAFKVVELDYVELRKDQFVYRLTLVRCIEK